MLKNLIKVVAVVCIGVLTVPSTANAGLGDPFGSFNILIEQGGFTVANETVTIGPGGDLIDLRPIFVDGTPEDHTLIGTIGVGGVDPIILKVVSDGGPDEAFRLTHWYIDVPVSLLNIHSPGPTSLFDPAAGKIDVTITSMEFSNGAAGIPLVLDLDTFYTSYMRDYQGHFYEQADAHAYNAFGNGIIDIQVPGSKFLDGNTAEYDFEMLASGTSASWRWANMLPPSLTDTVNNGFGASITPTDPGYVFELGMAVAFVQVPEPTTIAFVAMGAVPLILRRKRR
jgi:hypothetical protein